MNLSPNLSENFDQVTGDLLLAIISSLDPHQLNFQPISGGWTAGQVGDHLLKSYGVVQTLRGKTRSANRNPDEKIWEIKKLFLDFSIKMESPAVILPRQEIIDRDRLLAALEQRIQELHEVLQNKDLYLICEDYAIPEYGEFTRLEWLWFTVIHTYRHLHQLEKIKQQIKKAEAYK